MDILNGLFIYLFEWHNVLYRTVQPLSTFTIRYEKEEEIITFTHKYSSAFPLHSFSFIFTIELHKCFC